MSTKTIKEFRYSSDVYQKALSLRYEVLRKPLGLEWTQKDLEAEDKQLHFGLFSANEDLIACVTVVPLDKNTAKIRQMAVAAGLRGKGLGAQLIREVEQILRAKGFNRIEMNTRKTAIGFYEKLGYVIEGDEFLEVTIPHIKMTKNL
jgi:predicted GNAT family N-acyltransferase